MRSHSGYCTHTCVIKLDFAIEQRVLLEYCEENRQIESRLFSERRDGWQRKRKDIGTAAAPRC
jgi:hypothetical protein